MITVPDLVPGTYKLTRDAAKQVSRSWWVLLLSGAVSIVAGFLIFSINWTVGGLATFLGALFILEGLFEALTTGIGGRVRQADVISGLLSIAVGVLIIAWPGPGLLAVAIVFGAWLVFMGTFAITGSFRVRDLMRNWWLVLIFGILEVALGVLALANPGATLAALIIVAGIWAITTGVLSIVLGFEVKGLPGDVDRAFNVPAAANGAAKGVTQNHQPTTMPSRN